MYSVLSQPKPFYSLSFRRHRIIKKWHFLCMMYYIPGFNTSQKLERTSYDSTSEVVFRFWDFCSQLHHTIWFVFYDLVSLFDRYCTWNGDVLCRVSKDVPCRGLAFATSAAINSITQAVKTTHGTIL